MLKPLMITSLAILVSGCINTLTPEQTQKIDNMSPCEKIDGLINGYEDGFTAVKKSKVSSKFGDIWQANYNLVGDNCQITHLDGNQVTYKCNVQYDEKAMSRESFKQALQITKACLDPAWQATKSQFNETQRVIFNHPTHKAQITIHSGRTLAKYRKTWQTSFAVGDVAR